MKKKNLIIVGLFLSIFIYSIEVLAQDIIQVSLVYPQQSNAPKREASRIEKPATIKDSILIEITNVKPQQLNNADVYIEYYLDDQLIYTTENMGQDKTKTGSFSFTLDTMLYPDGTHTLVINLWDKNGPSAIGIKQIIIKN